MNYICSFLALLSFGVVHSIVLKCDFKDFNSYYNHAYTCEVQNLTASVTDRKVSKVEGTHLSNKNNSDVEKLFMRKQKCPYLLLSISKYFPNLEILYVMNSNVQHLLNGDLDGLEQLKTFDVSHNPIESLSRDFFKGHSTIETISFFDCHLKRIHPEALDPLVNLKAAYFDHNVCTQYRCDFQQAVEGLKTEIRKHCQSESYESEITETLCEDPESSSFVRRNAYGIIFFMLFLVCALSTVLVLIVRRNPWISRSIVRLEDSF